MRAALVGLCEQSFDRKRVAAPTLLVAFIALPDGHSWAPESLLEGIAGLARDKSPAAAKRFADKIRPKMDKSGLAELIDGMLAALAKRPNEAAASLRAATKRPQAEWLARVALLQLPHTDSARELPIGVLPLPRSDCPQPHLLTLAEALGNYGEHEVVVRLVQRHAQGPDATPRLLRVYARSLGGIGKPRRAVRYMELALHSADAPPSWHASLGFLQLDVDDWQGAERSFSVAVGGSVDLAKSLLGRAMARARSGNVSGAKEDVLLAVVHEPKEPRAWALLGEIAIAMRDTALLAKATSKLNELAPKLSIRLNELAQEAGLK